MLVSSPYIETFNYSSAFDFAECQNHLLKKWLHKSEHLIQSSDF